MNKRYKRGVTLLETVMAMLLLTIITGTAFVLCSRAANSVGESVVEFNAVNACEDVVRCFEVADSYDGFKALLVASGYEFYYTTDNADSETSQSVPNPNKLTLQKVANGYFVYAQLADGDGSVDMNVAENWRTATLNVYSTKIGSSKKVYNVSYVKGGGND